MNNLVAEANLGGNPDAKSKSPPPLSDYAKKLEPPVKQRSCSHRTGLLASRRIHRSSILSGVRGKFLHITV